MHYTSTSAFIQTRWNTTPWRNVTSVFNNIAQAGPWEEQEFQILSTKALEYRISLCISRNYLKHHACHTLTPFLLAHTIFSSATLYHDTRKQVTSQTATLHLQSHISISAHHHFGLFLERVLSAHLAGKQHLILQHNLAPVLQIIAAGEMAPA